MKEIRGTVTIGPQRAACKNSGLLDIRSVGHSKHWSLHPIFLPHDLSSTNPTGSFIFITPPQL